jgi:hypothetical protein
MFLILFHVHINFLTGYPLQRAGYISSYSSMTLFIVQRIRAFWNFWKYYLPRSDCRQIVRPPRYCQSHLKSAIRFASILSHNCTQWLRLTSWKLAKKSATPIASIPSPLLSPARAMCFCRRPASLLADLLPYSHNAASTLHLHLAISCVGRHGAPPRGDVSAEDVGRCRTRLSLAGRASIRLKQRVVGCLNHWWEPSRSIWREDNSERR